MNSREQMLDELGKLLTELVQSAELGIRLNIKLSPTLVGNKAFQCKNLVNKLKGKEDDKAL